MATPPRRPSLPNHPQSIRRSFTAPHTRLPPSPQPSHVDPSDSAADILYSHPATKVFSFSQAGNRSVSSPASNEFDYPVDAIETLPWSATTERMVAQGHLMIEKVRGSATFLKSGTITHPIMKGSQCWCVDGDSKFVLRVRQFQYYRIEFPNATEEDKGRIEELKQALRKLLRFEMTPCPFMREFKVELPDSARTPRKKKAWQPRQSLSMSSPLSMTSSMDWSEGTKSESGETTPDIDGNISDESDRSRSATPAGPVEDIETAPEVQEVDGREEAISPTRQDTLMPEVEDTPVLSEDAIDAENAVPSPGSSPQPNPPVLFQPDAENASASENEVEQTLEPDVVYTVAVPHDIKDPPQPTAETSMEADEVGQPPEETLEPTAEKEVEPLGDASETAAIEAPPADLNEQIATTSQESTVDVETVMPLTSNNGIDIADEDDKTDAQESDDEADAPPTTTVSPAAEIGINEDPNFTSDVVDAAEQHQEHPRTPAIPIRSRPQPQQLTTHPSQPESHSLSSSVDSFHSLASFHSPISPLPPSPPYSNPPSPTPLGGYSFAFGGRTHKRDMSEMTVVPDQLTSEPNDPPTTPKLLHDSASDGDWPDVTTPAAVENVRRRRRGKRSGFSPLPPASTLLTSPPRSHDRSLPSAIVQKAASLALGKPIEAVILLMHILGRIAHGATVNDLMSGDLFKRPETHQRTRSKTSAEVDNDWGEDDYGVPIRGRSRSHDSEAASASWDLD